MKSINIPQGVTNIEEGTFFLCENLESITLPENLNQISRSAFSRCSSLNNMDLPKGLKSIGYEAFLGCSRLKSIDIPEGVTSIANSVFEDCSGLEKVNIPEGITTIVSHMFDGCSSLKTITIPKSVTRIENCAFGYCDNLLSIDILGDKLTISSAMILDSEKMRSIRFAGTKEKWDALNVQFANVTVYYNYDPNHEHHYVTESITDVTCTKDGKEEKVCTLCGDFYETIIKAPGHSWNDGEVTKKSTCIEAGVKTYTCTVCKETRTEEIEATGHQHIEIRNAEETTCSKEGYTGDQVCKDCDTVVEKGTVIAKKGHTWNVGEVTTSATCEEKGVKTYTCTVCKATKTEDIPASGHTEVTDSVIEPTCETIGKTEGSHCSVCNEILVPQKTLEATGHAWGQGKVTKEVTCTEIGEKAYTCSNCGKTRTEEIPAAGHKFGSWTTRNQATVDSPEIQVRSCDICKKEEEREVGSKLEKTMTVSVSSFPLKTRQKTKVLKVTGLVKGDSIISWKSDNTKIVKILGKTNGTSTVTAGKKTGKARITITLKSGLKKVITVSVQKNTVKTKKISGVSKNLKLKRKQKVILHPVIAPLTSAQKITYKSNNTKIVTVNSKGQITAKKKGTAVITVKSGNKTTKCKVTVK